MTDKERMVSKVSECCKASIIYRGFAGLPYCSECGERCIPVERIERGKLYCGLCGMEIAEVDEIGAHMQKYHSEPVAPIDSIENPLLFALENELIIELCARNGWDYGKASEDYDNAVRDVKWFLFQINRLMPSIFEAGKKANIPSVEEITTIVAKWICPNCSPRHCFQDKPDPMKCLLISGLATAIHSLITGKKEVKYSAQEDGK